jgi:hypothetical protein
MSAAPMGMPGCPLFACCTPSAASMRIVLTHFSLSSGLGVGKGLLLRGAGKITREAGEIK